MIVVATEAEMGSGGFNCSEKALAVLVKTVPSRKAASTSTTTTTADGLVHVQSAQKAEHAGVTHAVIAGGGRDKRVSPGRQRIDHTHIGGFGRAVVGDGDCVSKLRARVH